MPASEVDTWFAVYDNPMKPVVQAIRAVFMADGRLDECIKWKSPTFTYKGNLASFNPRSKKHASLMFHVGATIPGDFPSLEGTGETARTMKLTSLEDVEVKTPELQAIIEAWVQLRG